MHKRCIGIKGKQNDNSKFKCQTCANQETYTAKNCVGMKLNVCYVSDIIGAWGGAAYSVAKRSWVDGVS